MLRKKPSLILYFACVHKDTARYVLSYSKPFGLLPKDLALIGMVALQSRAASTQPFDVKRFFTALSNQLKKQKVTNPLLWI